jgi:hypothetical protein
MTTEAVNVITNKDLLFDSYGLCEGCERMNIINHNNACEFCQEVPSEHLYDWGKMADLTHETRVAIFGWCPCRDNEGKNNPYEDCSQ